MELIGECTGNLKGCNATHYVAVLLDTMGSSSNSKNSSSNYVVAGTYLGEGCSRRLLGCSAQRHHDNCVLGGEVASSALCMIKVAGSGPVRSSKLQLPSY